MACFICMSGVKAITDANLFLDQTEMKNTLLQPNRDAIFDWMELIRYI